MTTLTEAAENHRKAIETLETLAREGHGPTFTQKSAGAGYTHITIGQTTEDFCAAIIALGKMKGACQ